MSDSVQKLDKFDVLASFSSVTLTAALDVLCIKDISLTDAHSWGRDTIDEFVINVARKKTKYKGSDLSEAIRKLEEQYPMYGDKVTSEFGGGNQHHLRDFTHHLTPIGLFFSILMQFTGRGYGTDKTGKFISVEISDVENKNVFEKIYMGTVSWLFHLISDVDGSGSSGKKSSEGTGIPGPMLSILKELSSIPIIRNIAGKSTINSTSSDEAYNFSKMCSKLFNGTLLGEHDENGKIIKGTELRFDFRTELGIVNESLKDKQYIPVLLNDLIVSAFYSVRRFLKEVEVKNITSVQDLKNVDVRSCLPWKNQTIKHMRAIACATFSTIDISAAGIKAAVRNDGVNHSFAKDFLQNINYWGLGSSVFSINSELTMGMQKLYSQFKAEVDIQKYILYTKHPNSKYVLDIAKYSAETAASLAKIGTPTGFVVSAVGVYDVIKNSLQDLKVAAEERARIEAFCAERIEVIDEYKVLMEQAVSEYFEKNWNRFLMHLIQWTRQLRITISILIS